MKHTLACLLILTGCSHTRAMRAPNSVKPLDIQGHRGARSFRPENTLSAFRYALDAGVTTLEIDAVLTKDGVVMVTHDHQINPKHCLDADGRRLKKGPVVLELTRAQVQSYDCGSLTDPDFPQQVAQPGERIPTLDELYTMALMHPNGKNVIFSVETKMGPAAVMPPLDVLVDAILAVMRKHGAVDRSLLSSFDIRSLDIAREREPGLVLSWLLGERPEQDAVAIAKQHHIQIISPSSHWITAEDVAVFQASGLRVIPWTVNTATEWQRLIGYKVDGIITDNPKDLVEYYRQNKPVDTTSSGY